MSERRWYALRVRYVKTERIASQLSSLYPDTERCFVPPVNGLLFVYTTRAAAEDFIHCREDGRYASFIWDKTTHNPIVVREKAMEDFILVCSLNDCPITMTERPKLTLGAKVRVVAGPLKGVEGRIVRMRKSRRILVEVEGILWAATEFVDPSLLEVIAEASDPPAGQ